MADYTTKHNPDPKWTPNLNALIEFMPDGFQAQAASSELTKLKAIAALAEERAAYISKRIGAPDGDFDSQEERDWYRRFKEIT